MSDVSGAGDLQTKQLEATLAELVAREQVKAATETINRGYDQTNTVSQRDAGTVNELLTSQPIPVPTLPAASSGSREVSAEDINGLQSTALTVRDALDQELEEDANAPLVGESSDSRGGVAQPQTREQSSTSPSSSGSDSSSLQAMVASVQAGLPASTDAARVVGDYENSIRQVAASIQQTPGAALSAPVQALSVAALNASPSVAKLGSLAVQRLIDDIVVLNRERGGAAVDGDKEVQQQSADLYGIPEQVRLSLLSQRLGIGLDPLVRTREAYLEGVLSVQRGILLSLKAMSNTEFLELLKERLREDQVREDQQKEAVEKLKQAIAALKAGEPKFAAEILNSASLITTALEQVVDRYTSDETPGSLRQHLKEHLALVLDSVVNEGSHQDMMKRRIELLRSTTKA
ncbi:hypothetical protein [Endozoicomonas sp.]|uniref:hypothetical protein n=1 Tax=Endozoicomonas sp. TaxID=1892382 RepID=UPI003AF6BB83